MSFLLQLPVSVQQVLEHEPTGLPPTKALLVAIVVIMSLSFITVNRVCAQVSVYLRLLGHYILQCVIPYYCVIYKRFLL